MLSNVLAAAFQLPPSGELWNWQGTPFIVGACLLVLLIGSRTIKYSQTGPKMPLPFSKSLFNNISVAAFLACMSFGHVLGFLLTLGFANTALR